MEQALSYLTSQEKEVLQSFDKVIIWGYPLHTHTQSYLHACWVKTFTALGKDTYWFSDEQHESPDTFSYKNCLFIAEGFQESKIPLDSSNTYFINFCIYPEKYLRSGARLFEIRFNVKEFHDCNNDWKLDDGTHTLVNLSQDVLYEALKSNSGVAPEFRGTKSSLMNYEAVYMTWPTDLLPWEIDLKDAEPRAREQAIHYIGTPYGNKRLEQFQQLAKDQGIEFVHHDPWTKPIGFQEAKEFVQRSILAPDFRPESSVEDKAYYGELNGKNHLAIGYIPCRLYKNISYGHLPLTDSPHAAEHFGDAVVFDKDIEQLIKKGLEAQHDIERKHRAMKMIAERHTYLHRARDLLRAILQPRPAPLHPHFLPTTWSQTTIVSALIDIGRDELDGRKFSTYVDWFKQFLQIPAPMVLFVDPSIFEVVRTLREKKPTKIICQNFQATPLSWSTPFLQQTQDSKEWKDYAKNPTDINNKSAPYVALMHNKFPWVWDAIQDNPFKTDLFFWMDGGLTRFHPTLPYFGIEPHPRTMRTLRKNKQICAQIGGYKESYFQKFFNGQRFSTDELIGTNENIIMGGFWGGHIQTVQSLCEFGMRFFVRELIQKHRIENDQPTLFFHFQENYSLYKLSMPMNIEMPIFYFFLLGILND
jgi:hypothetical protein